MILWLIMRKNAKPIPPQLAVEAGILAASLDAVVFGPLALLILWLLH